MAPLSSLSRFLAIVPLLCAALLWTSPAAAQIGPVQLFDGTVRIAGEASVTVGAHDDEAFFNYTDYERNALRTLRLSGTLLWQPTPLLAVVAEARTDDFDHLTASAFYVRARPWRSIPLDFQAGRIPPVFGAYGRQAYDANRLLIGYPLGYQYLTSLRADAIPADAGDLLRMRGRGWLSSFPIGSPEPAPGVPLISAFRWDTGVQARWRIRHVEAAVAVTQGTLANPRLVDDNNRPQFSARIASQVSPGLRIGVSGARGLFISDDVPRGDRPGGEQTSFGADAEYSGGRWLVRGEVIWTQWSLPYVTVPPEGPRITARAGWIEGRYRITPRLYVAARADALGFSHVTGRSPAERRDTWDAGVRRIEAGAGYSLLRYLMLRGVVQFNERDGGRVTERTYISSQVSWWF
jgi:hypothetical protein